ncbi:MAG TPA: oligoendopeptidase F, partial [Anaerolineae bacterium]
MPTSSKEQSLPHWDMTVVYPSLESPEFQSAFQSVTGSIDRLTQLFQERGIGKQAPAPLTPETVQVFETIVNAFNAMLEEVRTVTAYITSFVATDSRNNLAQAKLSEFQKNNVRLSLLSTRLTAWIGSLDVEELIARSPSARDHAFMLRKAKIEAEHLMSPAEEELAAELRVTGSTAWIRLHSNFTSQLTVDLELDGKPQSLPMSVVRN